MTRLQWESLVEYALDLARQMMECGAEAWRADNTLSRIFKAYGLEVLDVHTMATQTAATVRLPDGSHYTSTSMIQPEKTGTNLRRLEGIQTIVTCTDLSDLAEAEIGAAWRIHGGEISAEGGDEA